MKKIKVRTKYDRNDVSISFKDSPSMTDKQYKDECDISSIIEKYGVLPKPEITPVYEDVTKLGNYEIMLNVVKEHEAAFASLPSEIRQRFMGDSLAFAQWLANPANHDEAVRLGLLIPREPDVVDMIKSIADGVTGRKPVEGAQSPETPPATT